MKNTIKTFALFTLLSPFFLFAADREEIDTDGSQDELVGAGQEVHSNFIYDQYPTIHFPTSAHSLISVSAYGDTVELEDGSMWKVSTYDGRKAMQWRTDEALSIVQNGSWFSSYHYRIVNRNSGASIESNLSQGPFKSGDFTYYVTDYDFARGMVTLANPKQITHWEIHSSDLSDFRDWDFSQAIPVIIGDNNDYDPNSNSKWECILINVKKSKKYVRAHQF